MTADRPAGVRLTVRLGRWWLRWTIGNGERFLESDWCMADPELAILMRRELRKRREKLKDIEQWH